MPWIVPCIRAAMFSFTLTALGGTSLTYLSDSYREVSPLLAKLSWNTYLTFTYFADAW
jgi:hypothetical protein